MLKISHNFYTTATGFLFAFKGLMCGLAAYYGWEFVLNGWTVPPEILWASAGLAFILSYAGLSLAR